MSDREGYSFLKERNNQRGVYVRFILDIKKAQREARKQSL